MPKKEKVGIVTKNAIDKTVTLQVEQRKPHGRYQKTIIRTKKLKAHDENNQCSAGDLVRVIEARPISKEKCWKVVEVIQKAM